MDTYFVYIITNKSGTVLYTGVTNNIQRRVYEHKNKLIKGFSEKYHVDKLVYVEQFPTIEEAIAAEKKIKGWTRIKKINLINSANPTWKEIVFG